MYKLILIFIIGINIYANENKIMSDKFNVLEEKINKIEQKNILLQNENIQLYEKLNNIESKGRVDLIKEFVKELNMTNNDIFTKILSFVAFLISLGTLIWTIFYKDKIRLKIKPAAITRYSNGDISYNSNVFNEEKDQDTFAISVSNLSFFPIYVNNIFFLCDNQKIVLQFFYNKYDESISIPFKIESKDSKVVHFKVDALKNIHNEKLQLIEKIVVSLKSGEKFSGTNRAFKQFIKSLK